jgi:hypothetical protein
MIRRPVTVSTFGTRSSSDAGWRRIARFLGALKFDRLKAHLGVQVTLSRSSVLASVLVWSVCNGGRLLLLRIDDFRDHRPSRRKSAAMISLSRPSSGQPEQPRNDDRGRIPGLGKTVLWRCSDISTVTSDRG